MPKRAAAAPTSEPQGQTALVFPGSRVRIPVPNDAAGEERALIEALNTHPELLARAERQHAREAAGEAGTPAEAVYRELGLDPPTEPEPLRRRRGRPAADFGGRLLIRMPKSVHRDLVHRASVEGVSVNQLVLAYISRGLGQADVAPPHGTPT